MEGVGKGRDDREGVDEAGEKTYTRLRPAVLNSGSRSYMMGLYPRILRSIPRTGPAMPAPTMMTLVLAIEGSESRLGVD